MLPEFALPDIFQKLGAMAWPLTACSVLATLVFLERLSFILFVDGRGKKLLDRLQLELQNLREVPRALREDKISLSLDGAKSGYGRGVGLLRLVAAISPILGLLGTILGIISAFQKIASTTEPVTPNLIADGLWEALLTTAVGLIIALPCVIAVTGLNSWRNHLMERVAATLNTQSLEMELRPTDPVQAPNIRQIS